MADEKVDFKGRRDSENLTKSPTDALLRNAGKGDPEVIKYFLLLIAYLFILLFLINLFSSVVSFILWIAIGFAIYKLAEKYGQDIPWISNALENLQNIGFSTSTEDSIDSEGDSIEPEEEEIDTTNYAEKFDEWRVTKETVSAPFVSAGDKIRNFSFNSENFYKIRLWIFLILVPLLVWLIFWNLITLPFYIWYQIIGFTDFQADNLSSVSGLFLSFFIIIRVYSHCTNNRSLPINTDALSDYDNYVARHLFIQPKKGSLLITSKGLLFDFLTGWLILISLYGFDGFGNISCVGATSVVLESSDFFSLFTLMLFVAVFVPVIEELLFRGFVLDLASEAYGRWTAIIISSILFALVHVDPLSIINAFIGGLIYGYVRIRTGSLWPSIFLHSMWNAHLYLLIIFCS